MQANAVEIKPEPVAEQIADQTSITASAFSPAHSPLQVMTFQVINAAPSIASCASSSSLALLPALNAAPSVPSAGDLATSPPASVSMRPASDPVLPNGNSMPVASHAREPAPIRAPVHPKAARPSLMPEARMPDMTANLTMATKDAFACVNAMFGSSLSHVQSRPGPSAAASEPTVTLSTKAAFAELNSMLRSDLPHHSLQPRHTGVAYQRPGHSAATSRQGPGHVDHTKNQVFRSNKASAEATRPIGLYRDTVSPVPARPAAALAPQPADQTEIFAIYEDTGFLPSKPDDADPHAFAMYQDTNFLNEQQGQPQALHMATADGQAGFQIYEDTTCLPAKQKQTCLDEQHASAQAQHKSEAAAEQGFHIYEDTQCLPAKPQHAHMQQGSAADVEEGFQIFEDTQCLPTKQEPAFAICTGTSMLQQKARGNKLKPAANSPVGLGVYEDTQFMNSPTPALIKPALEAQGNRPSPVRDEENIVHQEDKENCKKHIR